jgi:hypothetical protein
MTLLSDMKTMDDILLVHAGAFRWQYPFQFIGVCVLPVMIFLTLSSDNKDWYWTFSTIWTLSALSSSHVY